MCSVTKGVQLQGFIKMDPLLKQSGVARLSKFTPGKQHEFMMGKTNYLKYNEIHFSSFTFNKNTLTS